MLWFSLLPSTGDHTLGENSKCHFSAGFAGCVTAWEGKATWKLVGVLPQCLEGWDGQAALPHGNAPHFSHRLLLLCPSLSTGLTAGAPAVVLDGDGWAWADTAAPAYIHFTSWTSLC